MNTYHFLNNPTVSNDINSFVRKLEEAVASSFERQVKSNAKNENPAVIISSQVRKEEIAV